MRRRRTRSVFKLIDTEKEFNDDNDDDGGYEDDYVADYVDADIDVCEHGESPEADESESQRDL